MLNIFGKIVDFLEICENIRVETSIWKNFKATKNYINNIKPEYLE